MAAQRAMEKNPKTVHKALKYIKASVANQRALFGSRAPHYPSRQVEFAEGTTSGDDKVEEAPVQLSKDELQELKKYLARLSAGGVSARPSSPPPRGEYRSP
ncbi:hypothetical protein KP79_PYT00893 [Mizuhopecten yessoensis]|uniref:Uncharacterized protein n=1 Tax=Mizuhopecten yessoensis TaxID=6573 RepID=A0A210QNL2_MIZYE|nr:hypothetical protein KP79_PYT00893 [Mizuhopecten yessoensis]